MLELPDQPLDERVNEFLTSSEGMENIDSLEMTQEQRDAGKADYFAEERQIVIEVKSLETDTRPRVEKILEQHRNRPEFPHFYGGWELDKILRYLPDGNEINKQIFDAVTESIARLYRKANSQIRSTKQSFGLPNAKGLLILSNQEIDILSPEVIVHRILKTANKRNPDGTFQFTEIQHVLFLSEAHYKPTPDNLMGFLILHQPISHVDSFGFEEFLASLVKKWSEFNQSPLFEHGPVKSVKNLEARSVSNYLKDHRTSMPRHEAWRTYYRKNSYFHRFDDNGMKWLYKTIMSELTPSFLKGATPVERGRGMFWTEVFTHFLEEVNRRGMDMKVFQPISRKLGKEIERRFERRSSNES